MSKGGLKGYIVAHEKLQASLKETWRDVEESLKIAQSELKGSSKKAQKKFKRRSWKLRASTKESKLIRSFKHAQRKLREG